MTGRIYIQKIPDLEAVAVILIRNGYTVRQGQEKIGTKTVRYLEVDRDGV